MANNKVRPCVLVYDPLGDFAELSNFFPSEFASDGVTWPSVEHYYQAAKFASACDRERILGCATAAKARDLAWGELHAKVRPNWDDMRVAVMHRALRLKFMACEPARRKLVSTWPYPMAEDSLTDSFWGLGPDGRGRNTLGGALDALRSDLLELPSLPIRFEGPAFSGRSPESRISAIDCTRYEIAESRIPLDPLALASSSLAMTNIDELMAEQLLGEGDPLDSVQAPIESDAAWRGNRTARSWRARNSPLSQSQLATQSHDALLSLRSRAFDKKYSSYRWEEDARSAVPDWSDSFLGWLDRRLSVASAQTRGLVVGAGAGEEAAKVWSHFSGRLLLVDIGHILAASCQRQHPGAEVCCRSAEDLEGIDDAAFDFYCSLRTYQSAHFDCEAAIAEAQRVLRPDGLAVISVSDAYLLADGRLQRGQIVGNRIDLSASLDLLCRLSDMLARAGFRSIGFHSFETELVVFGYLDT